MGRVPALGAGALAALAVTAALAVAAPVRARPGDSTRSPSARRARAQLGVDVERLKRRDSSSPARSSSPLAVAWAGMIGFVGLVVPHLLRQLSVPTTGCSCPLSALVGAAFLVLADLAARIVAGADASCRSAS